MSGERIRSLKPEWLDDEKLAATSDTARMMSAALILLSDDYGRGRGNRLFLASRVYPYSSRDPRETLATLSRGLDELVACGFLRLYQVSGQDYFEVVNWKKHQRVDKPGKPRVPAPIDALPKVSGDSREILAPDLGSGSGSGSGSGTGDLGPGSEDARAPASGEFRDWEQLKEIGEQLGSGLASMSATDRDRLSACLSGMHRAAAERGLPPAKHQRESWQRFASDPEIRRKRLARVGIYLGQWAVWADDAPPPPEPPDKVRLLTHAEHARMASEQELPDWAKE